MGGKWDPTSLPIRPDIYTNFVKAAVNQISGGVRGVVAIPLTTHSGTAVEKEFYTIEARELARAEELFGAANIESIKFALQGGAKEVLVYPMPSVPVAEDFTAMRTAFETQQFNVFVFDGEESATEQDATLQWCQANRDEGKHFMVVFGGSAADDADPATGNARTARLADDYAVNLITGAVIGDTVYSSGEYAPYIAGVVAGSAINESTTYREVSASDVNKRLRNSEIVTALQAGSLVLTHDGDSVKIEQGLTTSKSKIRIQRARQAISTDIQRTARKNYIGKLNNNEAGQIALITAIEEYLGTLENENVLIAPVVTLDPNRPSVGDTVFLAISYAEVDSMERIFITINV